MESSIYIILLLHLVLSPSLCLDSQDLKQGLMFEEKTRLGSTPPSCHNKCNQCHPCMALQVPSLTTRNGRVQPGLSRQGTIDPLDYYDPTTPSPVGNKYSNYKPLGWKCRCRNHFYNP
ncbi:Epidermal patterning factor-like protein [Heracleum sosnowskyi]|uniref:Epidermal patterning factor-like protein n=1 Tax=Heracleum sosnowskyi TaxID=360622 RepID=A0AAD8H6H5_9APIA|nr:Epidermal patterning factor-like protein [Heracleum sosnowskyi]